jgi:signal transduction histidine kinase/ABC-type amino acid transport substrate-binding protein
MYKTILFQLVITVLLTLNSSHLMAQNDHVGTPQQPHRQYTKEHPLVYEDVWDLWPYSFLNDNGEPEGYNIDLIRLMMQRLNIPYIIKLKSAEETFNDLKSGKSDLTLGLAVGYHDEYGLYGKNAVTLFTQSVVTPKSKPVQIKTFRDLGKPGMQVIVNSNSMCYHLMLDYGWGDNAIPRKDIQEVIQQVSAREEGQIVWNTLTLKWLMNRYLIDNLQLTPVNMPHGEYKFMSNDQQLLDRLDDELTKLNVNEELKPLQDKWFYPEHLQKGTPKWVYYLTTAATLLLLIMLVYTISYRMQSYRLNKANSRRNRRLALILQTSQVHVWTYDILANKFSWRNENGQVAYTYSMEEFSQRYSPEDFLKLKSSLRKLAHSKKGDGLAENETIKLQLRAKDVESGDTGLRDYTIVLSVLSHDKHGNPQIIIGTKKDVTSERDKQRLVEDRNLRYWAIFNTSVVGIILFDKEGRLENINQKACEIFGLNKDDIIGKDISMNDLVDSDSQRMEVQRMNVYDDDGLLLNTFVIVRDISEIVDGIEQHAVEKNRLDAVKTVLNEYNAYIDNVLHESDVRLVTYSPTSHTLTILRSVNEVQHSLTQTRCMTLVNIISNKVAMRLLNDMDQRIEKEMIANIRTTLRAKGGTPLRIQFYLKPLHDEQGNVTEYIGLLRDISDLCDIEERLKVETAKVQEVDNTKNSFVRNMIQEIRTPMNTVLNYVGQFDPAAPTENELELSKVILKNADYLLHLINNILHLSRLQARMVEIDRQPCNFAELFESQCSEGWSKYQNADTRYIVENPYENLTIDIDALNLGHAIGQITANAAQHTKSGVVRARYEYIGRRLIISVDDTGEGIPHEVLERMNDKDNTIASQDTKGLGLTITKELVTQMDGTVEISSELGSGTTVYITLPCHASIIKRKKQM